MYEYSLSVEEAEAEIHLTVEEAEAEVLQKRLLTQSALAITQ